MPLTPAWYQFGIGVFASLGSYLYGYDLGVIAEVVASPTFSAKFKTSATQTGLVVSMFTTGAFFGAALGGPSGDYFGRRVTIMIGAITFCLGGVCKLVLKTWHSYTRVDLSPDWVSAFSSCIRGRVTALQQFMLGVGALVASWVSYGTYIGLKTSAQWRVPLGLQILPAAILGALILLFPESPRWLMDHNKPEEGLKTLAKLHAHGDVHDPWVRAEYEQIQEAITYEHEHEAKSYTELFTNKSCFRRVLLCCALQASIQMTGVSAIQYYSVTIYGKIGIDGQDTLKYQAINSIIALIAQFLCILLIDKFGRRKPLIAGNLGNMVTFIIATILLAKFPPGQSTNRGAQWGFIIMTWIYNFSFSATCGPLSWIIPAEVFDTRTRSKGVSLATMTSFAFNTMIGQVTPIAIGNIGYKYYYLFIICNLTNAIFFWLFLPETARLPLEEMNYLFSHAPWIVPGSDKSTYISHDLERKFESIETKGLPQEHDEFVQ